MIPTISIIVPVYNAAAYLDQCLESVQAQTYKDWECWLIDDGSTDDSGQKCENYAQADSRFHVYHKQNEGVSSARNAGIDLSNAPWVVFIDADDWITEDFLSSISEHLDTDLVITGHSEINNNSVLDCPIVKQDTLVKHAEISNFLSAHLQSLEFITPWAKAFKRKLIEKANIRFNTNMKMGEDSVFCHNYLTMIDSLFVVFESKYKFRLYKPGPTNRYSYAMDHEKLNIHINLLDKTYTNLCSYWEFKNEHYMSTFGFAFLRAYCRYLELHHLWFKEPFENIKSVLSERFIAQGLFLKTSHFSIKNIAYTSIYKLCVYMRLQRLLIIFLARYYTK